MINKIKGVSLDRNIVSYATKITTLNNFSFYIPNEKVQTKELEPQESQELEKLLDQNWAQRSVAKEEDVELVEHRLRDGTRMPLDDHYRISESQGLMKCHIPGPNGEGEGMNSDWNRTEYIILGK